MPLALANAVLRDEASDDYQPHTEEQAGSIRAVPRLYLAGKAPARAERGALRAHRQIQPLLATGRKGLKRDSAPATPWDE